MPGNGLRVIWSDVEVDKQSTPDGIGRNRRHSPTSINNT
jgi:hypothetical protein